MSGRTLLHTTLDSGLRAKLDKMLYDRTQGCVPKGAISEWIEARIIEFAARQEGYKKQAEALKNG